MSARFRSRSRYTVLCSLPRRSMMTASRAMTISKVPPIRAMVCPHTLTSTPVSSSMMRRVFPRVPISRARIWATRFFEWAKSLMSRTSRYASSSRRRNARSSEKPRAIAWTISRAFRASTGSDAPVSLIVTSPLMESTAIRVPVDCWSRCFVTPSGPMRTPSRSAGIRAYNMSVLQDRLLEGGRGGVDPEAFEEPSNVRDVPAKPFLRMGMIQGHRLTDVDHDDAVLPPEEIVFAHVRMDEPRLPDRAQVRDDVLVHGRGRFQRHFAEGRSGRALIPDICHDQHVVEDPFRGRDANAGVLHPHQVLVFLLGLRAAGSVRRMEDVRLLPRAHGIVQGRNHPVADQGRDGQERGLVEDLVVRLAGRRVLLLRPEGVDLGFEVPHLSVVEHRCENERPGRLRALWASEDVDRFRDETAAAHVARLGLRVAVLDVALFILELPDLDHEEIALADPHPFLQLARDTTEPTLAVGTHHADSGRPEKLVGNAEDFAVFRTRHPDADDFLFGHFSVDGEGRLKRLRARSLREIDRVGNKGPILDAGLPYGRVREGNRRCLDERRADDVDALRKSVLLIVHEAEPVYERAVTEKVAVRLELLLDVPPNLIRITERRLRFNPILPGSVHLERLVHQDVRGLVVLRAEVLLRLILEAAGIEPGGKLRLAPPTAGVLAGGPLGRVDDVRAVHFIELPSQALVLDAVDVVDHLPEVLAGDPPLLQHHQGGEDRRKIEPSGDL